MTIKHVSRNSAGALLWVANVQYFIVQIIVALAWSKIGYSWSNNTISDLANTRCGFYGSRFICSPLHVLMNISFIVLGITIISGAVLLQKKFATSFIVRFGFGCMAAAGVGTILVGLFPENSVSALHIAGAALPFVLGNLGMLVLGAKLEGMPKTLRIYTLISGLVGLVALGLFMAQAYFGLGIGGMERLVAYPQTIWMIVFGIHVLLDRKSSVFNK